MDSHNIKDSIIVFLIDLVCNLYSENHHICDDDKIKIKNNIINKLQQKKIINVNSINIDETKSIIIKLLSNELNNNQIENYNNYELIGNGSFSKVYKMFNPIDQINYAIKKIQIDDNYDQILFEVRSMAKLNHTNIVRYHTSWIESDIINNNMITYNGFSNKYIFIQMELCKCNLYEYLLNNDLSYNDKIIIIKQILNGLKYIHENEILHRDLKLENIFVALDNSIKIGDFGLATTIYNINYDDVGTDNYIAPEVLNGKNYSYKSDLYSLGVIIMEILYNFTTKMEKIICIKNIKNGQFFINHEITNIIRSLLDDNPENRLTIDNINFI